MQVPPLYEKPSTRRVVWVTVIGLVLVYVLGALTAAGLHALVAGTDGWWEQTLLRKGPHRLMRRCVMLWAVVFLAWFLKELKWRGWRDCGFTDEGRPFLGQHAGRQALQGFLFGLGSLGTIALLMHVLEARVAYTPPRTYAAIALHAVYVLGNCLAVALIEETLARGVFFRCLSRAWNVIAAALFLSFMFSIMHFMTPDRAAYEAGGVLAAAWGSLTSMFDGLTETYRFWIRLLNLTLMGLALCACVVRTRTIWLAVGLHAGWVWVKLMNGFLANTNKAREPMLWLGKSSDSTDSLLASALLIGLILWALYWPQKSGHGFGEAGPTQRVPHLPNP